jgi:tetratricopeptide (TPR) repeat protein
MCQGNAAFDAGALDQARLAYEEALAAARTPEQEVTALQKIGRTLERQAQYDRARTLYHRALRLQSQHPELDDSTTARTHLFLGWLEYRRGKYARARDHYYRALDLARGKRDDWLLGNLYNGLGLLQRRDDDYPEALALFRTALDYWCRADYAYGIAAVYANIGTGATSLTLPRRLSRWESSMRRGVRGNKLNSSWRKL